MDYALLLRNKHKKYLLNNNVYLGSIMLAHARFNYFVGNKWLSRLYTLMACVFSPTKIMISEIDKKINKLKLIYEAKNS